MLWWNLRQLKSEHPEIRCRAADQLAATGSVRAVDALLPLLADSNAEVRRAAARALEALGWTPSNDEERLRHCVAHQRWDDASRLGAVAVPSLLAMAGDTRASQNQREAALAAIVGIGQAAVAPLIGLLNRQGALAELAAVEALGRIGDPRAVNPLAEKLKGLARFLTDPLNALGGPSHLWWLAKTCTGAAVEALIRLGPSAIGPLAALLVQEAPGAMLEQVLKDRGVGQLGEFDPSNEKQTVATHLFRELCFLFDSAADQRLAAALDSSDAQIRETAAAVVSRTGEVRKRRQRLEDVFENQAVIVQRFREVFQENKATDAKLRAHQPLAAGQPQGPESALSCARCHKPLEQVNWSGAAAVQIGGSLPSLFNGVKCSACGRIECVPCKGAPLDAPCSWCGGAVSPTFA